MIDDKKIEAAKARYSMPKVDIVNTTSSKEYGQKLLNRK